MHVVFGTSSPRGPGIALTAWLPGCSDETEEKVTEKMDKALRDFRQALLDAFESQEMEQQRLPLPEDAPRSRSDGLSGHFSCGAGAQSQYMCLRVT